MAEGGFLKPRERRTVRAFADAFFGDDRPRLLDADAVTARVDAQLALMSDTKRVRSLHLIFWVVEWIVPLLAFSLPPFSRLSRKRRQRVMTKILQKPRFGALRNLGKIRALFIAGYYSDEGVKQSIGFVRVRDRGLHLEPPKTYPVCTHEPAAGELEVDLCVIGSGAGGAVVAARAAAAGKRVALLEQGDYVRPEQITDDEQAMIALTYKEHGLQSTVDLGMTILQGRVLGGTTFVNNAICFRLGDPQLRDPGAGQVLEDWRELGADVDAAALQRSYDVIERDLQVTPVTDPAIGASGHLLIDGWKALSGGNGTPGAPRYGFFRKNLSHCVGCGYCNYGCAFERKLSTLETYVKAVGDSATGQVIPNCHVERLERRRGSVRAVRCRLADGRSLTVRARAVVVSAGAIGSSVLLMNSGFRRNVGTRFSFNAATPVIARFDRPLHSWRADQMTAFVDCGPFLLESSFDPPMSFAVTVPGWFQEHFERMEAYDRLTGLGVVVGTEANGRVKRWSLLRDLLGPVDWTMTDRDLETMKRGIATAAQVYFKAGASVVYPPSFADEPLHARDYAPGGEPDAERIADAVDAVVQGPGDLLLNSAHPQGGNPMSDDRSIGVIGSDFRVHGMRNLFVCDASVFPTTIHVNPQLTVMAMADYAWRHSIAGAVG